MEQAPEPRISKSTGYLMIGTAIVLDLIGIIPVAHWIVDAAWVIIFPLWFGVHNASFFKGKDKSSLVWMGVTFLLELIPVLADFLPGLSLTVVRNVLHVQKQDKKAFAEWQNQQENQNVERQKAATERYRQFQAQKEEQNNPPPNRRVDSIRPPAA
jgi:hypothetical protein